MRLETYDSDYSAIVTVDFDKTIAITDFPHILGIADDAKEVLDTWVDELKVYLIINTCREHKQLQDALDFLDAMGVRYHAVNEQHPLMLELFGYDARKIGADIHVDDKNVEALMEQSYPVWLLLNSRVREIITRPGFHSILRHPKIEPED